MRAIYKYEMANKKEQIEHLVFNGMYRLTTEVVHDRILLEHGVNNSRTSSDDLIYIGFVIANTFRLHLCR